MQTKQYILKEDKSLSHITSDEEAKLVLIFGSRYKFENLLPRVLNKIQSLFPNATIAGCTSHGEISQNGIVDDTLTLTSVSSQAIETKSVILEIERMDQSKEIGERVAKSIPQDGLKHLFLLTDGLIVNGSSLLQGIKSHLSDRVTISGGLSADGKDFMKTLVVHNDRIKDKAVVAVGLYGEKLVTDSNTAAGWTPFGTKKTITSSDNNTVYTIDNQPALDVYKKYLGDEAKDLPASGLLYPLQLQKTEHQPEVARTLLGINEEEKSLIFAGDIPEGSIVRLMHADFDELIRGAEEAAKTLNHQQDESSLVIIVSCAGRRFLLGQRCEFEIDAIMDILGENNTFCGYYSYGEIAPATGLSFSALHNQSVCLTKIKEKND